MKAKVLGKQEEPVKPVFCPSLKSSRPEGCMTGKTGKDLQRQKLQSQKLGDMYEIAVFILSSRKLATKPRFSDITFLKERTMEIAKQEGKK